MTNGYANGQTAAAAAPPIAKAQLEINVPFRAQLKFAKGILCAAANSKFPEAGDQMMFTLVDERKLYVPAYVAERMTALGGQDFIITRKQALASRKITWVVNRSAMFDASVHEAVAAAEAAVATRVGTEPAYDDGDYSTWGAPPPAKEEARTAPVAPVPPSPSTRALQMAPAASNAQEPPQKSPSRMAAALIAAIDATAEAVTYAKSVGITLKFSEEDVRCVAATIYIQNSRNSQ